VRIIAGALFAGMLALSLGVPQPHFIWRLLVILSTVGLVWRPLREIIFLAEARSIVQAVAPEVTQTWRGEWRLLERSGVRHIGKLSPASASFGSLLLLIWSTPGGRRWSLIDARVTSPHCFRALKGRLHLERTSTHRSGGYNC